VDRKTCPRCKTEKDVSHFARSSRLKDGLQYYCIECSKAINRAHNARRKGLGLKTYSQKIRRSKREKVLVHYGGNPPRCQCCGETTFEFLGIEHLNGGGTQHRAQIGQGQIYVWLTTNGFPDGYGVLCHNCNFALGIYGYCPHQNPSE
jgi:hypothetical protein